MRCVVVCCLVKCHLCYGADKSSTYFLGMVLVDGTEEGKSKAGVDDGVGIPKACRYSTTQHFTHRIKRFFIVTPFMSAMKYCSSSSCYYYSKSSSCILITYITSRVIITSTFSH